MQRKTDLQEWQNAESTTNFKEPENYKKTFEYKSKKSKKKSLRQNQKNKEQKKNVPQNTARFLCPERESNARPSA